MCVRVRACVFICGSLPVCMLICVCARVCVCFSVLYVASASIVNALEFVDTDSGTTAHWRRMCLAQLLCMRVSGATSIDDTLFILVKTYASRYRCVSMFWTHRIKFYCFCDRSVREKACRAGDVSAAACLQVAAGELAAATRLR